jgi:hypothetical protein
MTDGKPFQRFHFTIVYAITSRRYNSRRKCSSGKGLGKVLKSDYTFVSANPPDLPVMLIVSENSNSRF